MPYTAEQTQTIQNWIHRKITNGCPMCGQRNWNLDSELGLAGTIDSTNNEVKPASGIPIVQTTCSNCGFKADYAAKVIGVI